MKNKVNLKGVYLMWMVYVYGQKRETIRVDVLKKHNYMLLTRKPEKTIIFKRWWKICHTNSNQKKVGVVILISGKGDFWARKITRDKEWLYIIIILKEDLQVLNVYASNNIRSKYIRRRLTKMAEQEQLPSAAPS